MYQIFHYAYGLDLTKLINKLQTVGYKHTEEEYSICVEIEENESDDIMFTAYAGSGNYPYYVGVAITKEWTEFEDSETIPDQLTQEQLDEAQQKILQFIQKYPITSKYVSLVPKVFLVRQTS